MNFLPLTGKGIRSIIAFEIESGWLSGSDLIAFKSFSRYVSKLLSQPCIDSLNISIAPFFNFNAISNADLYPIMNTLSLLSAGCLSCYAINFALFSSCKSKALIFESISTIWPMCFFDHLSMHYLVYSSSAIILADCLIKE